MKYTTIVNEAKIADNLLNVYGANPKTDLTKAGIYGNMSTVFEISAMYAQ